MTRNQKYEKKQRDRGLKKVTLWIPDDSEVEIKQMIDFLIDNPDHIPFMARSVKTGRMKKAI
ncbi:hypothetical protein [Pseudoalteromonas sp. H105]|jgi:hypothetical protein|uniref:hypothetical protein n=1 Tax=Pseudoalteromonas sp. H105 TaxID=1348393 RepID=UPI0007321083|nr:hypothetical protein [Pseudoalteromonas sp. H105]KTF16887.1 hypothetical protein ATS75_05435 [Pseudoalteromonas sp. H105]